jgi:hypothetical protein
MTFALGGEFYGNKQAIKRCVCTELPRKTRLRRPRIEGHCIRDDLRSMGRAYSGMGTDHTLPSAWMIQRVAGERLHARHVVLTSQPELVLVCAAVYSNAKAFRSGSMLQGSSLLTAVRIG